MPNRFLQLLCLGVALACVGGAGQLSALIQRQQHDLQLTFTADLRDKVPPSIELTTAALGSFRGLLSNVLWYRAEQMKQQGRLHESNTLAQWITTLQPRYPQVWLFQSWNLAYNISVTTNTPQERMDWVDKGIRLLRDQGIPNNPDAVGLYRHLSWTFFHKVGQYSDDQHWYYKARLAAEWQELLGAPPQGGSTQEVVDAFRPIAEAYDRYVNQATLTRDARAVLEAVTTGDAVLDEETHGLADLPLVRAEVRMRERVDDLRRSHPDAGAVVASVLEQARAQLDRGRSSPMKLLAEENSEAAPILVELAALGLPVTGPEAGQTLRRIGRLLMYMGSPDAKLLGLVKFDPPNPVDKALVALLTDGPKRPGVAAVLATLRAQVIANQYHMDPDWMLHLMEEFGPIDWRHASAHGLYWASMGVHRARNLRNKKDIDLLNTIRAEIHSLQDLTRFGRISYDPVSGYIDQMPEPRFIDAYEKRVFRGIEEIQEADWSMGTRDTFDSGHENFLIVAVVWSYLYGDEAQARRYYDKLREMYGDKPHNQASRRYEAPLLDFVTSQLREDGDSMANTRQFVDAMLNQAFTQGLGAGRLEVYERLRDIAKPFHERFQARAIVNPTAVQDRMTTLPFEQLVRESFGAYMQNRGVPLLLRLRAWNNAPGTLRQAIYERVAPALLPQLTEQGFDPQLALPAPPGVGSVLAPPEDASSEKAQEVTRPAEGVEVERK